MRTLLGLILAAALQEAPADAPVAAWTFEAARFRDGAFAPERGTAAATSAAPARFSSEAPHALRLGAAEAGSGAPKAKGKAAEAFLRVGAGHPGPTRELSVEAWVKIEQPEDWGGLVGMIRDNGNDEHGWLLGYNRNSFTFALASTKTRRLTYLAARRIYQTGAWYQVAATYDGAEMRLYVDGVLAASDRSQSGDIDDPAGGAFVIGAYHDENETHPLSGEIHHAAVWKRVLSGPEIRRRFDDRKTRYPGIEPVKPSVVDWPTHLHDAQRSGMTDAAPNLPLGLRWTWRPRQPPRPAWPAEAKQDFYNGKPMPERTTFDHAFHVVSAGGLVCFGSSADDQVRALDLNTGRLRWTYAAEGPIRISPTIADGKVIFGSDDGCIYAVGAKDGALAWKLRPGPDRRLPGNERVISAAPVRSGVLVDGTDVHYGAGLFAGEGVLHGVVDLSSGLPIRRLPLDGSLQGYLELRAGRLFAGAGRVTSGAFVAKLRQQGKNVDRELAAAAGEYPFAFIGAGPVRFAGGDGKVAAFDAESARLLWSAPVEGRALSLAFAQGRLLVGTDRGVVHAFAPGDGPAFEIVPPPPIALPTADGLPSTLPLRGYALVLGVGDGRRAAALACSTSLRVVAVEADPARTAAVRRVLDNAGLGGRVSIHDLDPTGPLPYTDWMFNVVLEDGATGRRDEIRRVLRPLDGRAWDREGREIARGGPVEGAGDWTHLYATPANTACSEDRRVGGDLQLQWFGPPGPADLIDRHHRTGPPLHKDGRVFLPGNDRVYALDAYNGTLLWERRIPDSRRMVIFRDCGNMVAGAAALYVAAAGDCLFLDPATGEPRRRVPAGPGRDWGYLAVEGDALLGTTVLPGASQRELSRRMVTLETYWDFKELVLSDSLFALGAADAAPRWTYRPEGAILNPTITLGDGRAYFVESADSATLAKGRAPLAALLGKGARVVALDLATGKPIWTATPDLSAAQHVLFAALAKGRLLLTSTRNVGQGRAASVWYDVRALDAATGAEAWFQTRDYRAKTNGEHGEQDHHPAVVGERLYVEPWVFDLRTGREIEDWGWKPRRGCGTFSASASTLYFRDQHPYGFDLGAKVKAAVTKVTRPGCWINMIPAGGLLLIPEGSSGCSCDFAIQSSLAFIPVRSR